MSSAKIASGSARRAMLLGGGVLAADAVPADPPQYVASRMRWMRAHCSAIAMAVQ